MAYVTSTNEELIRSCNWFTSKESSGEVLVRCWLVLYPTIPSTSLSLSVFAGFNDHVSYGCKDYRRTVATVLQQIDRDPALLTDDRRVEVDLVHV